MIPEMREYLCRRNNWTWDTVDKIDWAHFEIAVEVVHKQSKPRFSRMIKFQHDIQNTGRQRKLFSQNGQGPMVSDRCPCCMVMEETTMHLHQCRAPVMRALLKEGVQELEDNLRQRHMPSAMWTTLRRGIMSFCEEETNSAMVQDPRMVAAAQSQMEIGWDNFLKGRVASEWITIMGDIYKCNHTMRKTESKRRFAKVLILGVWEIYDRLWKKRCETLHDMTDVNSLSVAELDTRIRFNFDNKHKLFDSGDYDRFHLGLQNTLALSVLQKRAWIQTLSYRQNATERARKRMVNKIRPITAYFDQIDKDEDVHVT